MKKQQDKYDILKTYYGYDTFRDGQEELIDCLLNGQDVCGIMPTGAGKSVCYQVPALLLPHVTLVVSPLISLMKDQVRALNQMGVHAAYLNSSLSWNQYKKALAYAKEGRYKIIYVAPERLLTDSFLSFAKGAKIAQVVVDDDVAVDGSLYTVGRRGVAGTVFVHKIAGAKAEQGAELEEVQRVAQKVIDNVRTMGVAIRPCTVPAAGKPGFELGEDEMEVGIGIHGEPGVERAGKMTSAEPVS